MKRVTLTLDAVDVDLIDRLGAHEGMNRSQEIRAILQQFRPMMEELIKVLDFAAAQRDALDQALVQASIADLEAIQPEAEELARKFMGMTARLEGHAAASAPASNTGATLGKNTGFPGFSE